MGRKWLTVDEPLKELYNLKKSFLAATPVKEDWIEINKNGNKIVDIIH